MADLAALAATQSAWWRSIDPMLPAAQPNAAGHPLVTTLSTGHQVAGLVYRTAYPTGSWDSLWSPTESYELTPFIGDTGRAGLAALLSSWRAWLSELPPAAERTCLLTWPSRDVATANVLLEAGFAPATILAIRPAEPPFAQPSPDQDSDRPTPGLSIRRATVADLDDLVTLELAELRYSAMVGPAVERPNAAELLGKALRNALSFGGRIWLAESEGAAVGEANCGWASTVAGTLVANRLPTGRWGYVGTLSVAPTMRGTGIGTKLMRLAHRELAQPGVRGTFLFYNPPNPLSTVFWHRQGYRPLWTTWQIDPTAFAGATPTRRANRPISG